MNNKTLQRTKTIDKNWKKREKRSEYGELKIRK